MAQWPQRCFWGLARLISRLRYRVEIQGLEQLRSVRGPTLVMPNHPGYIDPPLVLAHLRLPGSIRPVVTERMYRNRLLYPMMRLVDALEVPELAEHSQGARQQTLAMIDAVVAGLARGENFLIYPSGRTQRRGTEVIGASRAVSEILQRSPQANVVLVRTTGAWGSMFSWAQTGQSPDLARGILRGLLWILLGLVFFMPRRRLQMTVEVLDRAQLPDVGREKLNRFLEEWYNRGGYQPPVFVPYHLFLGPRSFRFPDLAGADDVDLEKIRPATIRAVNQLIEEHLDRPLTDEEQQAQTELEQIGLDSLERMELSLKVEDRFGFRAGQVANTLGDLWTLAEGLSTGGDDSSHAPPPGWNRPVRDGEVAVLGTTLAEAFVRRCLEAPDDVAVADRLSGVLSYRRLLVGCRLLSKRLAALPGDSVAILLPSSVGVDVVFFATHLAGKLPVMLNWTTGPAALAHAVRKLNISCVVTSRKLIDRLGIQIEGASYVFVEDLRATVGKLEALATLAATYLRPGSFLRRLPKAREDDPAVVLFTSGSESAPKAVPLSHNNLLIDLRNGLKVLGARPNDTLLGFLPPFHSFGLTAGLLAPVLTGFRVVHHPDPTDARGLVRTFVRYRATMVFTTPTFFSYMLGVAGPDDLKTLRVVVTGAEKCPEAVFHRCAQLAPDAMILEGYGITECSPVVAGNRPGKIRLGTLGQALDEVELCVVDPDSHQPLPSGATGMLLVHGPTVFSGYIQHEGADPFAKLNGKRWYVTGDLVRIDEEGYIHFCGRLKRFLKAGGEMISLPALEEPLAQLYPPTENGPQVAVEGIETPDGRHIVLFTTTEVSLREANAALNQAGFRGVMRLDEVVRLEQIPVLGTGKTDYKVLRKMVVERVGVRS